MNNCNALQRFAGTATGCGITRLQLAEVLDDLLISNPSGQTPSKPKMTEDDLVYVFHDIKSRLNSSCITPRGSESVFEKLGQDHLSKLNKAYSNIADLKLSIDGPILTINIWLTSEDFVEDIGEGYKCIIVYNVNGCSTWRHRIPEWQVITHIDF